MKSSISAAASREYAPVCPFCGYSRQGLDSPVCPECGETCPRSFRLLSRNVLLPWECRVNEAQPWRFLRTLFYALRHYARFLQVLQKRTDIAVHQERQLLGWLGLTTLAVPMTICALGAMLSCLARHGISNGVLRAPLFSLRVTLASWPIWAAESTVILAEALTVATVLSAALPLKRWRHNLTISLFAITPALLILEIMQRVVVRAVVLARGLQPNQLADMDWECLGVLSTLGLAACTWLSVRIVWKRGLIPAMFITSLVGFIDWWVFPFVLSRVSRAFSYLWWGS